MERDTAVRGRPESESGVINCHLMRSIGSVEVVQYMCTLFAIEYPPREDFEGGNYSATLFSFPQIRSIFVYTRFVESLYCTYGIWATTRHGPSHVVVVVVVVV